MASFPAPNTSRPRPPPPGPAPPRDPPAAAPAPASRSGWIFAVLAALAVVVALVIWRSSAADSTPTGGASRARADKRARTTESGRRAAHPDDRDPDDVDPPAAAPRLRGPGEPARTGAPGDEQTVSVILDVEAPSEVFLDKRPVGHTPMDKIEVPPGTHELMFRHESLGERKLTIDARLGVQTIVKVDFDAKDEPDAG